MADSITDQLDQMEISWIDNHSILFKCTLPLVLYKILSYWLLYTEFTRN
jgi:hypothetical protein